MEKYLLDMCNVQFDRDANGALALTSEGAHSQARIVHSTDKTGLTIMESVSEVVQKHPNISYQDC